MKKLIVGIIFCFLCIVELRACDINVQVLSTSNLALNAGSGLSSFRVTNNSSATNPAFTITINSGVFFIGTGITSPASVSITNIGVPNPIILIPAAIIAGNGGFIDVIMQFETNDLESCNIISDFTNQPYTFNTFDVSFPGCGAQTDFNAPTFSVFFPRFHIALAQDFNFLNINQVFYRKIEVINNGNLGYNTTTDGNIKVNNSHVADFEILDIAKEIAPNVYSDLSVSITNPQTNSEYNIDATTFNTLMSGSNVLPTFTGSEKLVYFEKIKVLSCTNSITSQITPYWHINSQWCPTGVTDLSYFTRILNEPNLNLTSTYINPPRDYCYGNANENDIALTIANASGTSASNNMSVHLFKASGLTPNFTEVVTNSFVIKRTVAGVTTTLTNAVDYTISPTSLSASPHCDGQFYYNDFVIDFDDNLTLPNGAASSNNIKIEYKIKTCCPPSGSTCFASSQHYDTWRANVSYGGFCDGVQRLSPVNPATPLAVSGNFTLGNTGGFSYEGPFNIFVPWGAGSPPTFSEPYDVTFSYTGIGNAVWPYNSTNYQFYIDVKLESDLVFCGTGLSDFSLTSSALGTINPTAATFTSGSNNPGIVKTLRLYFTLTNNITTSLANSDLKFCIKGHCPNSTASIDLTYYYLPDANCSSCVLPFACYSQPLTVQCPGCLRQGIHSDSYKISRTTFGLVDANNNGRWDGGSPIQIDASNVNNYPGLKKKRIMVGDEFEGVLKTHVELNGYQPYSWSYNGSTPPQLDFYHGYWHSSYSQGQNITPVSAWVQIIEMEVSSTCSSPPCTTTLNLPAPQVFNTINSACYAGLSGVDFFYDFSIAALQAANPGVPNIPIRFSQSMQLEFHNKFRQTGNVGIGANAFSLSEGNNLIYLTLRPETSPNVFGVPGGCPQDPDNAVAAYGNNYDTYCTSSGIPFPCEDIQWFCTKQGDTYTQVGFATGQKVGGTLNISSTGCRYTLNGVSDMAVGRGYLYGGVNAFPFEYRNWSFIDHVDITFPLGFNPLGLTFGWLGYNSSGYPHVTGSAALTNAMVTNLTPTSATLNFAGLTDDGSEGGFPAGKYFGPNDDSYYYDAFHISFDANCYVSDGGTLPIGNITWNEFQSYAPQLVGYANADGTNPITANPDPFPTGSVSILHNSPDLIIQNQTPNVSTYGFNDPVTWNVLVTNTTSGNGSQYAYANNVWVSLTSTSNTSSNIAIHRLRVQDQQNPGTYYNLVDANGNDPGVGNYQIGNLYYIPITAPAYMQTLPPSTSTNNYFKYEVSVYHVDCSEGDEIQINTGWMCSARLNTMIEYQNLPCSTEIISSILIVDPTPSDLLVCVNGNGCDLNYIPVNAQPCSTVTYNIKVESHELGFLDAIDFNMTLLAASGLTFSGSASITYQGILLGTVIPVGSTLSFNLTNPIFSGTGLDVNGLPGLLNLNYTDPDDHFFIVSITLQTGCEFSYNLDGGFQLNVNASCCQQSIEQYVDFYNPILESPTFDYDNMIVDASANVNAVCSNAFNTSITITNNSSTPSNSTNNVLYVDVPVGVALSNFSTPPTNPGGPSPYVWSPSVLGGLVNGTSITITFDATASNNQCGTESIIASLYTDDNTTCMLQPCSLIHQLQSQDIENITITPPASAFTLPTVNPCAGQPVNFSADVICGGVTYEWNIDGTIYTGASVAHTFSQAGSYSISLLSSLGLGGCNSQSFDNITVDTCSQPCTGTDFTYIVNGCQVDFTGIAPPSFSSNCDAVMYAWNFGDGTPPNPYSTSNLASHTYSGPGMYFVCMAAICYDIQNDGTWKQIEYCKQCIDVEVRCARECDGASFTADIRGCNVDFTANVPNMTGCSTIEYAWGFGDGNNTGNSTSNTASHTYTTSNTYNVCFEAYCKDGNGNIIYTCKHCADVKVECSGCDNSKLTYDALDCGVKLYAIVPNLTNCHTIKYEWDFGDGNSLPEQAGADIVVYKYCESGTYKVCYKANCYDENGNLLYSCEVCEYVTVSCADLLCAKIENPASGSFTGVDVGREVVSTPDGGYIVVGTVNANSTSPSLTNSSNEGDAYLIKYNQSNGIDFQIRIGDLATTYFNERGHTVLVRPDAYYVGSIQYRNYGVDHDILITKVSLAGVVQWSKRYGHNNSRKDEIAKLVDMNGSGTGNILVVGSSNNSSTYSSPWDISNTNNDFIIFAIDNSGAVVPGTAKRISRNSANTSSEYARDAVRIDGSGGVEFFIAGDLAPCTSTCPERDAFIVKLDPSLTVVAGQVLTLPGRIETVGGIEGLGGNLFVAGSNILTGSTENVWITELSPNNLSPLNSTIINHSLSSDARANDIIKTTEGKLVLAGRCSSATTNDGLVMQIDIASGLNIDWTSHTNVSNQNDAFSSVSDKYILTGNKQEPAPFNQEIFIANVCSPSGMSCCVQPLSTSTTPLIYSNNLSVYSVNLSIAPSGVGLYDVPAYPKVELCGGQTRIASSLNIDLDNGIKAYPNPSSGEFTIEVDNVEKISGIKIMDFSGRIIKMFNQLNISSNKHSVSLQELSGGIYFIEATTPNGKYKTKISIQH